MSEKCYPEEARYWPKEGLDRRQHGLTTDKASSAKRMFGPTSTWIAFLKEWTDVNIDCLCISLKALLGHKVHKEDLKKALYLINGDPMGFMNPMNLDAQVFGQNPNRLEHGFLNSSKNHEELKRLQDWAEDEALSVFYQHRTEPSGLFKPNILWIQVPTHGLDRLTSGLVNSRSIRVMPSKIQSMAAKYLKSFGKCHKKIGLQIRSLSIFGDKKYPIVLLGGYFGYLGYFSQDESKAWFDGLKTYSRAESNLKGLDDVHKKIGIKNPSLSIFGDLWSRLDHQKRKLGLLSYYYLGGSKIWFEV